MRRRILAWETKLGEIHLRYLYIETISNLKRHHVIINWHFFSPAFSDQCRSDDAIVQFSIFDHDVITANDFGGEAFFALKNVPGVQCGNSSVGNFRGLKQVDLPLMFQENKGKFITVRSDNLWSFLDIFLTPGSPQYDILFLKNEYTISPLTGQFR